MKITVGLNTKSIKNAVKALETAKKQLEKQMLNDLIEGCAKWFIERANEYVMQSDIGFNVKSGITAEWKIVPQDNKVLIKNTHDKAVYVEFGVGQVGAKNPHKNAEDSGYKYDVFSIFKDNKGAWQFVTSKDELDIPQNAVLSSNEDGTKILVRTIGATGVRYAYNAIMDLAEYGAKEVWQEIKAKYWG